MSQWCECGQPSKGSIGMLRLCRQCFAVIAGWRANDKRLKQRTTIQLMNDGRKSGLAEWVPDVAISRERQKAVK